MTRDEVTRNLMLRMTLSYCRKFTDWVFVADVLISGRMDGLLMTEAGLLPVWHFECRVKRGDKSIL